MDFEHSIWGELTLEPGKTEFITIGELHLWILLKDSDIWIGYKYSDSEAISSPSNMAPPEDLEWGRWAMKGNVGQLKVMPVFPDMPLVVKSEYPLKISSATKIQIFTRVPVWVRLSLSQGDYNLIEIPIVKLSRTWFGSPLEGELCYHATTKARRDLSKVDPKPYLVNCPIMISNKADEDLDFENFCYRVERLGIYRNGEELWADETQIIYHGENLNSDVIMTGKLPEGVDKKQLVTKPRKQIQKSLATQTFKRFFEGSLNFGR